MNKMAKFDGLEVAPVMLVGKDERSGTMCYERADDLLNPSDADLWSVYGHCRSGGVECLEDFDTRTEALIYADELLDRYPYLMKHGLSVY